jgi:quercetin dioxygenase-like cupin family protein
MSIIGKTQTSGTGAGRMVDLGIMQMRFLAAGEATRGGFTLAECAGSAGRWTVPHRHEAMEESFYVLDGEFTFTLDDKEVTHGPGGYVLVPRGTSHVFGAGPGGGRCLVLMVPGGLEGMFYELGELGADSLRDPAVRAAVSARYDSHPT